MSGRQGDGVRRGAGRFTSGRESMLIRMRGGVSIAGRNRRLGNTRAGPGGLGCRQDRQGCGRAS